MIGNQLIRENIVFLKQGIELLQRLDDELYVKTIAPYFTSGVGKHIRHNLEHYECFLSGLSSGKIDYDRRQRDPMVESDRAYAAKKLSSIIPPLEALIVEDLNDPIMVKMNDVDDEAATPRWSRSTIGRELQFLMSHTVHHYALIALILKFQGFDCDGDFGVAPSTLKYRQSKAA